jgi:hypothetical protein
MEMIREEKALTQILAHELSIPKEEIFFFAAKALETDARANTATNPRRGNLFIY